MKGVALGCKLKKDVMKRAKHFWQRLYKSFGHAIDGIVFTLKTQPNARIHTVVTVIVIAAGFFFDIERSEWVWLGLVILLVWFAELINTAFEYLCDLISPEHNESVHRAKDIAAGAVLLVAVFAALIGIAVFYPYVKEFLLALLSA